MAHRVTDAGAKAEIRWPQPAIVEEILRRQAAGEPAIAWEDRGEMIAPAAGDVVDVPKVSVELLLAEGFIEEVGAPAPAPVPPWEGEGE
jgi:hypothetical protein